MGKGRNEEKGENHGDRMGIMRGQRSEPDFGDTVKKSFPCKKRGEKR